MSGRDRRPYLTAPLLTQQLLDFMQDNLDMDVRFVVEIDAPEAFARRVTATLKSNVGIAPATMFAADHRLILNEPFKMEAVDGGPPLPPEVNALDTYYPMNVEAGQFKFSATPDGPPVDVGDGFTIVEYPVVIHAVAPVIRLSNRNTFVGPRFYEARTKLPAITRTVGEWLAATIEFSTLELTISNVDGAFNAILPGGVAFAGMLGRSVRVRMGLAENQDTYRDVWEGQITPEGGIKRGIGTITIIARDKFDSLNRQFPFEVLTKEEFPTLPDDKVGEPIAYILGDWTVEVPAEGCVTSQVVNGDDPDVNGETSNDNNVQVVVCSHDLEELQATEIYVVKGEDAWLIDPSDVVLSGGSFLDDGPTNARFEVVQNSGATQIGTDSPTNYLYETSDEFLVKVKGREIDGYEANAVWQARHLLMEFGGALAADFDASWSVYRDKASPAQSAIATIKSRVWVRTQQSVLEYAASLLDQVRLEFAVSSELVLKLVSNHLEDFDPAPAHRVRQWDIVRGTLQPATDERAVFNRLQAFYGFNPRANEEAKATKWYRNTAAIDQMGRTISKNVFYPNLYVEADVAAQIGEVLKVASAAPETVSVSLTARALLKDVGDFVKMSVNIMGTVYQDVPMMIREIGFDPDGAKLPVKLWSMQVVPFANPGGWNPGYTGIVGGDTATITEE